MNKYLSFLICAVALAAFSTKAAPAETGVVAQIHFAGADTVAADPNSTALKYLWLSQEAQALRQQTLDKLSRSIDVWLHQHVAPGLTQPVALRPLLDDLSSSEWQLDARQPTAGTVEFALAIRLDAVRAITWQRTLKPLLDGWGKVSTENHSGLVYTNNWLVLELGNSTAPLGLGAISSLKNLWLTVNLDWQRLRGWFPQLAAFDIPRTHLQVAARNGNFEVGGKLYLSNPLPPLEKWQFPTGIILSPLISFTAARGVSPWLKQQPWFASLGLGSLPDQVFAWVTPQTPFSTYAAMPMAGASAALPVLEQSLSEKLHSGPANSPAERYSITATNHELTLTGIPFMSPFLAAKHIAASDFLVTGFFPLVPFGNPVPATLQSELTKSNLVFYHWETTSARFKNFPQLYQLLFVATQHRQLDANSAAAKWLALIAPSLGASVTGAIQTGPAEITFNRKSPAALTSVELVALVSWLEAPNFPGCNLDVPLPKFPVRHLKMPGGPSSLISN